MTTQISSVEEEAQYFKTDQLEKDYDGIRKAFEDFQADWPNESKLVGSFFDTNKILFIKEHQSINYTLYIFSRTYEYRIYVSPHRLNLDYSTRTSRVGETWSRSKHLDWGHPAEDTIQSFVISMLQHELVHLEV